MDLGRIAIRALFAFLFLFLLIRISGKRTVAQGSAFDFVVALILGDLVDDLLWQEVPALEFVVATATLFSVHIFVTFTSARHQRFGKLIGGSPRMLIRAGSPLKAGLRGELVHEREAEEMMRVRGIEREDWDEIKSAWIHTNGRPSVVKQEWARTAQKKDLPE